MGVSMGPSVGNTYLYQNFGTLKGNKADGKGGSGGKHGTLRIKHKYVYSIGLTRRMGVSMGPYVENTNLRIPYPLPSWASILTYGGKDGTLCRKYIFIQKVRDAQGAR